MAVGGVAVGRAGLVSIAPGGKTSDPVQIIGITEFLRAASKADANFNKEMRIAAQEVASSLVVTAKVNAMGVTRNRQAHEVMKGMRARHDRIPTIKLDSNSTFVSRSRRYTSSQNMNVGGARNRRLVTRGDVFFGAEFGGGARKGTRQFLRHRGRSGYFFWPAVRQRKHEIAKLYLEAIDKVLAKLAK